MTRKDFELIAKTMRDVLPPKKGSESLDFYRTHRLIVNEFAHVLASTNPRFDRERFEHACTQE